MEDMKNQLVKHKQIWICVAVLFFSLVTPGVAQISSGTVSGNVLDPSGAAVAGAKVTLLDEKTHETRIVSTDTQGEFTIPQVAPDSYTLTVTSPGFSIFTEHNIEIHVNQSFKINAALSVASNKAEVSVSASDLNVNTETSEISSLISPLQMEQVPLNGRNFLQLMTLVPGSAPGDNLNTFQTGLLSVTRISLSGTGDDASVYTIDGAQMRDPGGNNVIPVFPSIDSIQEFRIQTNAYGPQFGGGGGAQVNILTKSGTNIIHGSAYDFFRNDDLDANSYLLDAARQPRGKLRYNDFGYTVGGPIKRDRAYFFFSQEFRRQEIGVPRAALVPTDQERAGDFSADAANYNSAGCYGPTPGNSKVTTQGGCGTFPIDPNSGHPLGWVGPNSPLNVSSAKIPTAEFDAAGQKFLDIYPSPNTSNVYANRNWVQAVNVPIDTREESARGDYKFNDAVSLLVRYTHDAYVNGPQSYSENLWGDDGFPKVNNTWNSPADTLAVRLTQLLGTGVNTVGYSRTAGYTSIAAANGASINASAVAAIPTFYPKTGPQPHALFWGAGGYPTLWSNAGFYNDFEVSSFSDDFSKVMGKHTLVAGGIYNRGAKNDVYGGCACSDVPQFGGAFGYGNDPSKVSNNAIADLLFEGMTFGFNEVNASPHVPARYNNFEFYAGDTYKALRNLTINYGFRWSLLRMPYSAKDNIASFYPGAWSAARATDPLDGLLTTSSGYGRSLVRNQNNLIAPRVGLSWDVFGNGNTVVRSGFGQFFATVQSSGQFLQLGGNPPFVKTLGGRRYLDRADGFDNSGNPISTSQASIGHPANGIDPNLQNPTTFQWNLSVARQITPSNILQVAYVGNRGVHNYIKSDINQILPQYRQACVQARLTGHGCASYRPFGGGASGAIGDNGITYLTWAGDSIYHGLQASYQGRMGKHTEVSIAYTWSKIIGDTGLTDFGASPTITDTYSPGYDRGLLSYDRRHILSANFVYSLPELRQSSSLLRQLAGGWQIAGVTELASGTPLTIGAGPSFDYTAIGNTRPDLVLGASEGGPKSLKKWFNTSAYTLDNHVLGQLGTVGRGSVRAPGIANQDLSLDKTWDLPFFKTGYTDEVAHLQFRAEAYNAPNHTQPVGVDTNLGASNITYDPAKTKIQSWTPSNGDFGHVTSYRNNRQLQLGLKLTF